jgi:hypothetical protein
MNEEVLKMTDVIKSELLVKATAELDDAVKVELEVEDPEKEVAKAMLNG